MFGFGKTERGMKKLRSALAIYLAGDWSGQQAIINRSQKDTETAARAIADGKDPYQAGALLVGQFARDRIAALPAEDRARVLRTLSSGNSSSPPRTMRFAADMCMVLAKLEGAGKPLIPLGTTAMYLECVAEAFTDQAETKKMICSYIYSFAARSIEAGGKKAE